MPERNYIFAYASTKMKLSFELFECGFYETFWSETGSNRDTVATSYP